MEMKNISLYGNNNDRSWEVKIPSNSQEKYLTLLPTAYCLTGNHVEKKPV